MATYYCTDADITDRISTDLTGTQIADATTRTNKLRAPATAWVDSKVPLLGPFADAGASPATPDLIRQAAIAYALSIAHRILSVNATDAQAQTWEAVAKDLLQVDAQGVSHLMLSSTVSFGTPDLTRDRDEEREDEQDLVM